MLIIEPRSFGVNFVRNFTVCCNPQFQQWKMYMMCGSGGHCSNYAVAELIEQSTFEQQQQRR